MKGLKVVYTLVENLQILAYLALVILVGGICIFVAAWFFGQILRGIQ